MQYARLSAYSSKRKKPLNNHQATKRSKTISNFLETLPQVIKADKRFFTDDETTTNQNFQNIASLLTQRAREMPNACAIAEPNLRARCGIDFCCAKNAPQEKYRTLTFAELDADSDKIAFALRARGFERGMRIALMVRYSIDFIALVFGLFKAGAVIILIDPGMGMRQMLRCLAEVEPDGFAAISAVQAVRTLMPKHFPQARHNITVGKKWWWGGLSLDEIRASDLTNINLQTPDSGVNPEPENAAIIFTSGSTGPAKGVLYTHAMFAAQVAAIQSRLEIIPGGIDLAAFPFFGLFNAAMGTTTIIPDFDSTRPAQADPRKICEAANDWKITQSFASPALWKRVSDFCHATNTKIPTLKRCISAGAPIPFSLLERLRHCIATDAEIFTPYGATEALPVSMISASEILRETAKVTQTGGGICVGTRFENLDWRIIAISDEPVLWRDANFLPIGEIGELIVCGEQVTREYIARDEANRAAKIVDDAGKIWHRMGDVGYFDATERFWFCGRKNHRVTIKSEAKKFETKSATESKTLFSIPCEAIFLNDARVSRAALVGIGVRDAQNSSAQTPIMGIEPKSDCFPKTPAARREFIASLRALAKTSPLTSSIEHFFFEKSFPVDIRHNAKINRELLAKHAEKIKFIS